MADSFRGSNITAAIGWNMLLLKVIIIIIIIIITQDDWAVHLSGVVNYEILKVCTITIQTGFSISEMYLYIQVTQTSFSEGT